MNRLPTGKGLVWQRLSLRSLMREFSLNTLRQGVPFFSPANERCGLRPTVPETSVQDRKRGDWHSAFENDEHAPPFRRASKLPRYVVPCITL